MANKSANRIKSTGRRWALKRRNATTLSQILGKKISMNVYTNSVGSRFCFKWKGVRNVKNSNYQSEKPMAPGGYWPQISIPCTSPVLAIVKAHKLCCATAFPSTTLNFHFIFLHFLTVIPYFISVLNSVSKTQGWPRKPSNVSKNGFPISDQYLTMAVGSWC